jgi:[protein-PII] uridylyltransferase
MKSPCKTLFKDKKEALLSALEKAVPSSRSLHTGFRQLLALADHALRDIWADCQLPDALSLVAVGGYGRGELYPHSDIDVLILLPDDWAPVLEGQDPHGITGKLEAFISACWDNGLEMGSSVRSLGQCMTESAADITIQTALLESRRICGSPDLYEAFQSQFHAQMDARSFFAAKTLEMRQRHSKYEDTPYALEPNCKESPGGMRDLHVIAWVAKAAGLGNSWNDLCQQGLITAHEVRQIQRKQAWLGLLRMRLHLLATRREDRLVFDLQHTLAQSFGIQHKESAPGRMLERPSETLMRKYYWCAKAVVQLNQILLLNIEAHLHKTGENTPLLAINDRFSERQGLLEVSHDALYQQQPSAILETFLLYQQQEQIKGLSAKTLRALYNARGVMNDAYRKDPTTRAQFMAILQSPTRVTQALRLLNQTSVLGRTLWPFRRIVGQMQHDLFHVYTVDQHILMVLRNVRRFFRADHAHEYPFCSQLASGWDKPWLFCVAALFHDIAKGRGGDHSALGAQEVRRFCKHYGITGDDAALIEFLVAEHLLMSHVAQKEDLSDPDVIQRFAQRVGTERRLTALYLLTVADIRGTSPKVWNAWKGKLLEDLYRISLRVLGGRRADATAEVEIRKREARAILTAQAQPHLAELRLWETLQVSYFMRHDASEIAWHARHLAHHLHKAEQAQTPASAAVRCRPSPAGVGLQVMVFAPDQQDLFARICGYFDRAGFSILEAKIHTTISQHALDTFQVISARDSDHYREWMTMVESDLTQALTTPKPLAAPIRGRVSRRVRHFPMIPRIHLRPDEKGQQWLLSVSASDRPGLLYSVAYVLARHGVNVQLAKISTLGERVEDNFLIDSPGLQGNKLQTELEAELIKALASD